MKNYHSCRSCKFCDLENMRCLPASPDDSIVYSLEESDLDEEDRCDCYKPRNDEESA